MCACVYLYTPCTQSPFLHRARPEHWLTWAGIGVGVTSGVGVQVLAEKPPRPLSHQSSHGDPLVSVIGWSLNLAVCTHRSSPTLDGQICARPCTWHGATGRLPCARDRMGWVRTLVHVCQAGAASCSSEVCGVHTGGCHKSAVCTDVSYTV